jgi:hypothetical protein
MSNRLYLASSVFFVTSAALALHASWNLINLAALAGSLLFLAAAVTALLGRR